MEGGRDATLPFHLRNSPVRGRVARLDEVLDDVLRRHNYPEEVNLIVAEAAVITVLVGQLVNPGWKFSLQFRSDGPLRMLAADYIAPTVASEPARIRAYASIRQNGFDARSSNLISCTDKGYLAMLIDRGDGREPFKGLSEITGTSLAECAENYFLKSEQIPTRIAVATGLTGGNGKPNRRAGGMMIQRMAESSRPHADAPASDTQGLASSDEDWARACALFATAEPDELLGPEPSAPELLYRLFHEDVPVAAAAQPVMFGCTCSAERVRQSLSIYSAKDIATMTNENNVVTADCEFCGTRYELDPQELGFEAASQ